jgi:hypothetical protein
MVGDLAEYHDTVVGEGGVAARTTAAGQGIEARRNNKTTKQPNRQRIQRSGSEVIATPKKFLRLNNVRGVRP